MRRVLVVDDDPLFADGVEDELVKAGFAVERAANREALDAALTAPPAHVVLLDVRLAGPGGFIDGVDLAPNVLARWPEARVIVVSGFLTPELVRRAWRAGAVDILRKDELFVDLLGQKVRRAAEEAERDLLRSDEARERELREVWKVSRQEADRRRKGEALERVVRLLLGSIDGLVVTQRVMNAVEEIDLFVRNESADPYLVAQGPIWVVECKNWTSTVGVDAVHPLRAKMQHRYGRCRLGILVSMNGFAGTVDATLARDAGTEQLVLTLTGDALASWIDAPDRRAWLKARLDEATSR